MVFKGFGDHLLYLVLNIASHKTCCDKIGICKNHNHPLPQFHEVWQNQTANAVVAVYTIDETPG